MKVLCVLQFLFSFGACVSQLLLVEHAAGTPANGTPYQSLSALLEDIAARNRNCQIAYSGELTTSAPMTAARMEQEGIIPLRAMMLGSLRGDSSSMICTAENSSVQCEPDEWFRARSLAGACRRDRCVVLLPQSACDLLGIAPGPIDPNNCPETLNNHPDAQLLHCVWQHECSHLRSLPQASSCDSELEAFQVQMQCLRALRFRFCDRTPVHPLWSDHCGEVDRHLCNAALGEYVNECVCATAGGNQCRTSCGDQCPAPIARVPECAQFSGNGEGSEAGQACANMVTSYCRQQFDRSRMSLNPTILDPE